MKKIIIGLIVVAILISTVYLISSLSGGLVGGGGSQQVVPDMARTTEPITLGLVLSTWGKHTKPIVERYTRISLSYRLVGESSYKTLLPKLVELPSNYQVALSDTAQYEKYEFIIPAYPKNTTGEIEYYVDMTFDGYPNQTVGIKKIKLVN
jgi:hypothetical protein